MFRNGDLRDFFKKARQPGPSPAAVESQDSTSEHRSSPITPPIPKSFSTEWSTGTPSLQTPSLPESSTSTGDAGLDPPPSSSYGTAPSEALASGRSFVKSSDDEETDSDSSLEDLATILRPKSSGIAELGPTTPKRETRSSKPASKLHASPLAVLPKYKFDLKDLVKDAKDEERLEASSKRVKAMLERAEEGSKSNKTPEPEDEGVPSVFQHGELLESVVAEREDGGMKKVLQAMRRTEATLVERRWYYFESTTQSQLSERQPFPADSVSQSEDWRGELEDPAIRKQAFISGFVEDMIKMETPLPDAVFLWLLDEVYSEDDDYLRHSYSGAIVESAEQVQRLIDIETISKMLRRVGGTAVALDLDQKIRPVPAKSNYYSGHDWTKLCPIIKLFGKLAESIQQQVRTFLVSSLLRMTIDNVVTEHIDLFYSTQKALESLCKHVSENDSETFVSSTLVSIREPLFIKSQTSEVCTALFKALESPTLQLNMVNCIPPTSARIHDLRRRLALAFYFNNIKYTSKPSYSTIDLEDIRNRLNDPEFKVTDKTDFRELAARVTLLDIAVDDGQHEDLDLADPEQEDEFNTNVDMLVSRIKAVLRATSTTAGAAFISRIEAKEVVDLVSNRIMTIRTRRKPRSSIFDSKAVKKEEDLSKEKRMMKKFLGESA